MEHSSYAKMMDLPGTSLQEEQVLWAHCIAQACIDAASRDREIKKDVKDWLAHEDFEVVCGMAGMRPEHVRYVIMDVLATRRHKKAFKKAMHFRFLIRSYVESNTGDIDKKRGLDKSD